MERSETQEMYLIAIDKICNEKGSVRLVDIANERNFSKSTVHAGLKILEDHGYISINNNHITLNNKGQEKVKELIKKHKLIVESLVLLGLKEDIAEQNACAIEHVITDEVYDVLQKHVEIGKRMRQRM